MEVSKSIFKRQADFLEKNGKYLLQFTSCAEKIKILLTKIYLLYIINLVFNNYIIKIRCWAVAKR